MKARKKIERGSDVKALLAGASLTPAQREEAFAAMRTGEDIADVLLWVMGKLEEFGHWLALKPILKH